MKTAISSRLMAKSQQLSSQHPHRPARKDGPAQEHGEAVKAVADHVTGGFAVRDAEDYRCGEGEDYCRAEVAEVDRHNPTADRLVLAGN
jgi:hypothetical protein